MNDGRTRLRFAICAIFLTMAMTGLGFRLAFLHLGSHEKVRDSVKRARSYETSLSYERGRICDSRGVENILALDLSRTHVCAAPSVIVTNNRVRHVAVILSEALDLSVDDVAVKLNQPGRPFVYVAKYVEDDVVDGLREKLSKKPGELMANEVFFRESKLRFYPQKTSMCHVLGFVNREGTASAGVEKWMDRYLRGCAGLVEGQKNALGEGLYVKRGRYFPAVQGADVALTIDQHVQYFVENALDAVMAEHQAKGAWAIVERVRTGEILAMASRPGFDLNKFGSATANEWLNRAIGYVYEPGSTMKALVFSAALNERIITPDTVFDCENGAWLHRRRVLRDYHANGRLSVADGLKKSSNIMAAKISVMLGDDRFYRYLRAFGAGRPMGIDLPGEEGGILHPVSKWSGISGSPGGSATKG